MHMRKPTFACSDFPLQDRKPACCSLVCGVVSLLLYFLMATALHAQSYAFYSPTNPASYVSYPIGAGGPTVVHRNGATYVVVWQSYGTYIPYVLRTDESTGFTEAVAIPGADQAPASPNGRIDGHFSMEMKLDTAGYIHLVEVGHNESLRYWKSNLPDSIAGGFTEIAVNATNGLPWAQLHYDYSKLLTDNNGVIYMISRCEMNWRTPDQGDRGVTLHRYDVNTGTWTMLGGVQAENPAATIAKPTTTLRGKAIFWEWAGQTDTLFYQGFSANLSFDAQNRMHFTVSTLDRFPDGAFPNGNGDTLVYAYSDDGGDTWHRSDGSLITHLPMRARAGLANSADIVNQGDPATNEGRLGLQTQIAVDRSGSPLIAADDTYTRQATGWVRSTFNGNNTLTTTPNSRHVLGADGRLYTYRDPLTGGDNLRIMEKPDSTYSSFVVGSTGMPNTLCGDAPTFRKSGLLYGSLPTNMIYGRVGVTLGWNQADLGSPALAGVSASLRSGAMRIRASGGGFDSTSDQARFTWQTVSGDCVLVARLDSHTATNPAAWAGLSIRESTNASSRQATIVATQSDGFHFVTRTTPGAAAQTNGINPDLFGPEGNWLRLTRSGNSIIAEVSADADSWTLVGSNTVALPTDALVGLVASANSATFADFNFSQIGIQGLRNLAFGKPATQSSQFFDLGAGLATDGNTNGDWAFGSVATTYNTDSVYFWRVDLLEPSTVQTLKFYKRTDGARDGQLNSATVRLLGSSSNVLWSGSIPSGTLSIPYTLTPGGVANVRYVELERSSQTAIAEVEVFGTNSVPLPGPDMEAPDTPSGLMASARETVVTLTWEASSSPDVAGYVLQRGPGSSGPFVDVANDICLPRYVDSNLALGSNYYYRVAAIDESGNRSDCTTVLQVATTDRTPPAPPIITSLTYGNSTLTMGWSNLDPQPDFSHWELVRADRQGHETIVLSHTTGTNYTWVAPGFGQYSEFFLRAYDTNGNRSCAGNVISYLSGTNIALGRSATQGANAGTAGFAVDGMVLGGNSTDTGNSSNMSVNWWQVDLGTNRPVGAIELYSHQSDPNGLIAFDVFVIDASGQTNWSYSHPLGYYIGFMHRLYPDGATGRYVRVQRRNVAVANPAALRLAEVRVLEKSADWPEVGPVLSGRVLHLDAGNAANLVRDGYRVSAWTNLAPAGGYAGQNTSTNQPRTGSSSSLERHLVNFGPDGSERWMKFKTAGGADWRPTTLRTMFWVVKGANFLLGDGSSAPFHRGTADEGSPNATIWDSALASSAVLSGQTYLNGVLVDGSTTPLPSAYSVVSVVTTSAVAADRIGDDRNNPDRQGGLQLAEFIAYDTALSDGERRQVEQYLAEKWNVARNYGVVAESSTNVFLAPPANVIATPVDLDQINLTWAASVGATGYRVKRASAPVGPYSVIASGLTGTAYNDTGLNPSTTYYYVVSAVSNAVEGAESAIASARTLDLWHSQDVGAVGTAGSASQNDGVFTVSGAGADIGSTADAFHFLNISMTGDGTFIARLAVQGSATSTSKMGIAMRETLGADSKSVINFFDDGQDKVRVAYRTATGGGTSYFTAATNNTVPVWLKLSRAGDDFTGWYSSDGVNWTTLGTANVTMSNTIYVGLVVCSRNTSTLNTGTFDNLSGDAWDLWLSQDVGAVVTTGGASETNGVFTVSGAGADIGSTADAFHFLHMNMIGDGTFVARLVSPTSAIRGGVRI